MTFGRIRYLFFILCNLFLSICCPGLGIIRDYAQDPQPFDLIICEIMADPVPANALPECEFIELFNKSSTEICLSGWTICIGDHLIQLPDSLILPGTFVVITDSTGFNGNLFSGTVILTHIPHITNTGQVITIRSPEGSIIHSVSFTPEWYNDNEKDDGGWSVEMIDPANPCGGRNNWHASMDNTGGTPGRQNSVLSLRPDIIPPLLMYASLYSDTSLILRFSEPLYYREIDEKSRYSTDHGFFHPETVMPVEPDFTKILLNYNQEFKPETVYKVSISNELKDCAGNHPVSNLFAPFSHTVPPGINEVIINEILFTAGDDGEFIEIFNRSNSIIELSSLQICLADKSNVIERRVAISDDAIPLFPGDYKVICRSAEHLTSQYSNLNPVNIVEQKSLFLLPDDGALLVLADTSGAVIDEFSYSNDLHYDLLTSTKGISLERISSELPANSRDNWHSASSASGYASPGQVNSQNRNDNESDYLQLSSDVISPDADGLNDEVIIICNFREPGWTGNVEIYSLKGQLTKSILANSLIGTNESLKWDGTDNEGKSAAMGVYVVYAEFFSTRGEVKKFKKVVSVIRK